MSVAIIGHTGFVGSYIHRIYPDACCFNSKNISSIKNQNFDMILCSGINATKWLANKNPIEDWENIKNLIDILKTVTCNKKFILISTIDVYDINAYDINAHTNELIYQTKEAYGKHRYQVELELQDLFQENLLIIRLGALFGFGLKKNLLFDIIQKSKIIYNPQSCFQWYNMQWFHEDLKYILSTDLKVVNLFCEPIYNHELITELTKITNIQCIETTNNKQIYDIKNYWRCKNASLQSIKRFMKKMCQQNSIVTSSLIGNYPNALKNFNIQNIEIAPFSFFGENFIDKSLDFFEQYKNQNIYSFQSLFYPYNWKLDIDFDLILNYLYKLIDIALYLSTVKILVFGSPKLRSIPNACFFMTKLLILCNEYINARDIYICIEPNAKHYHCDFLTTAKDTYDFINNLNLSNIKLMLDTGNMYFEGENQSLIFNYINDIKHIHFSAPDLIALNEWSNNRFGFSFIRQRLLSLGYNGKFTMECLKISEKNTIDSLYLILKDIDFQIVGAGWFGCHISKQLLDHGYNISLFEKQAYIFNNVSSHNQNRLHLGFHYPRSFKTRQLCQSNYEQFLKIYGMYVSFIENNCYYISNQSCLDFETYKSILIQQNLKFEEEQITVNKLQNINQKCLKVKEGVIDFRKIKNYFENQLSNYIYYNHTINDLMEFGNENWILDCTYNELTKVPNTIFEPSLSLIYKQRNNKIPKMAITIMDGPFWSLYPYDLENDLYTLTHVSKGRTLDFDLHDIETDVSKIYPDFLIDFVFIDFFIVKKCLMDSSCASRELLVVHSGNQTSAVCGKITGIFDFESEIFHLL